GHVLRVCSLHLLGHNAGVSAADGSVRAAEATLQGGTLDITGPDVTVDGFRQIDEAIKLEQAGKGGARITNNVIVINSGPLGSVAAIDLLGGAGATISNNSISAGPLAAIHAAGAGLSSDPVVISGNLITSDPDGL